MYLIMLNRKLIFEILFFRKIEELEAKLEYERLKREKLESELDECRNEIARLIITLRSFEDKKLHSRVRFQNKEEKKIQNSLLATTVK